MAGVAGGVGTSTWTRAFLSQVALPVEDRGVFLEGLVDVLVTSNTAAATARLGGALARCERPPLLVVMHTVPGRIGAARAYLRQVEPHVTRRFHVAHQHVWLELDEPPGRHLPKGFPELVQAIPAALQKMYSRPPRPASVNTLAHDQRMRIPARNPTISDLANVSQQGRHVPQSRHGRRG